MGVRNRQASLMALFEFLFHLSRLAMYTPSIQACVREVLRRLCGMMAMRRKPSDAIALPITRNVPSCVNFDVRLLTARHFVARRTA
jgi:hypothetical protein